MNRKKEVIKTAKGRTMSSTLWLRRRLKDDFVALAKKEGYRSRAAFKLSEILKKYPQLLSKKGIVIDLGCAPGSWLQVLQERLGREALILGVDLQSIDNLPDVHFIMGDFMDPGIQAECSNWISGRGVQLLLSDMAPASCGQKDIDHIRIINLLMEATSFAVKYLSLGGNMVMKAFPGGKLDDLMSILKSRFREVHLFKPAASYKDSKEMFIIAVNYLGNSER